MDTHRISGIPVTKGDGTLVGILTNRDVRFATDPNTLGMVAVVAERGLAARTHPLGTALVAPLLLGQPLGQGAHQLFEAAE